MGQNQSAGTREGSSFAGNNEDSRTDYYQLLGLDRGASAEESVPPLILTSRDGH